jgi:hypothetical protein
LLADILRLINDYPPAQLHKLLAWHWNKEP